jgi:hypothetical protein
MPTVTVRRTRKNQNSSSAFIAAFPAGAHTSIYDDPNTIEEAKQRADWLEWQAAIQKEYRNLTLKGTSVGSDL